MDNVVEKLGFFDFLNYIIAGMYTIVGAFIISYQFGFNTSKSIFKYLVNQNEVNFLFLALSVFSIIAIAYILGMVCHEVFSLLDDLKAKSFETLMEGMFTKESCIDNSKKRERYKILAKEIFDNNGVEYSNTNKSAEIEWTSELNNYFFAYCVYQVQIRGLNKKLEKLRDIEGLAKSFCVSSILLLALLCGCGVFRWNYYSLPILVYVIEVGALIAITVVFVKYRKKALKNRIRMTLALFEAIYDKERKNLAEKEE